MSDIEEGTSTFRYEGRGKLVWDFLAGKVQPQKLARIVKYSLNQKMFFFIKD